MDAAELGLESARRSGRWEVAGLALAGIVILSTIGLAWACRDLSAPADRVMGVQ